MWLFLFSFPSSARKRAKKRTRKSPARKINSFYRNMRFTKQVFFANIYIFLFIHFYIKENKYFLCFVHELSIFMFDLHFKHIIRMENHGDNFFEPNHGVELPTKKYIILTSIFIFNEQWIRS